MFGNNNQRRLVTAAVGSITYNRQRNSRRTHLRPKDAYVDYASVKIDSHCRSVLCNCCCQMRFSPVLDDVTVNPLEFKGNYSATSNNVELVHWPLNLMGGLLHLVQRGGDWAVPQPARVFPRCTKCNSPPINSQYTNYRIAHVQRSVALRL